MNGVEVASATPGLDVLNSGSDSFAIGKPYKNSNHYFSGDIDDVQIFNKALSVGEIASLYSK